MSKIKDIIIHTKTQEQFNELMRLLEDAGYKWRSGQLPTLYLIYWNYNKGSTCVSLEYEKYIAYGDISQNTNVITFDDYVKSLKPPMPNLNLKLIKAIENNLFANQ